MQPLKTIYLMFYNFDMILTCKVIFFYMLNFVLLSKDLKKSQTKSYEVKRISVYVEARLLWNLHRNVDYLRRKSKKVDEEKEIWWREKWKESWGSDVGKENGTWKCFNGRPTARSKLRIRRKGASFSRMHTTVWLMLYVISLVHWLVCVCALFGLLVQCNLRYQF